MKAQLKAETTSRLDVLNHVRCKLKSIKCYRASEQDGDEIYLKVENKKIWPTSPFAKIKPSEEITINMDVISDARGFIRIDLWDRDFLLPNDLLGFFQFASVGAKGKFSTDLTPCNKDIPPRYVLTWEM